MDAVRNRIWFAFALVATPILTGGAVFLEDLTGRNPLSLRARVRSEGPTRSGPIQIGPDDRTVWVANPDANSVTAIDVRDDANRKLVEIPVGEEPQNVAISPDGRTVYVSNTVSGTVSVIHADGRHSRVIRTLQVGTEPYGIALTPGGDKLYVANARSNDVSVIDTEKNKVIRTIVGVGLEPRGIAITNDGDRRHRDEKVYVTQFLGVDRPGTVIGADDYKEGRVTVISTRSDRVLREVRLAPMAVTGFKALGDALGRVPPGPQPTFDTGAFPNMLNSVVIKGDRAYLPNTAASPNGPVRFNVNVQAFLSVIDVDSDAEGQANGKRQTINMNRGINFEAPGRIFIGVPWAVAFEHDADEGYVVAAASNLLVRVVLDSDGTPTINAPLQAGDPGAVVRIPVGQNPRGITINSADTRAYVMNEVSRDVSVVDLGTHQVMATVPSSDLPAPGTDAARALIGKAVFNSSTGVHLPPLGVEVGNRLSSEGWSGCVSCHPFGLTDGVVWIFATGPRRTIPLNFSFNPRDPRDIKLLNHSAINDELQDFELNIRNVSGGAGLITLADGTTPDPGVAQLGAPTTGRSALLDAMTFYIAHAVRTPISPLARQRHGRGARDIRRGRELFEEANCASCHGGGGWASGRRFFTPPPDPGLISSGQIVGVLRKVGTFDPANVNEVRANAASPLGADGYNPPSLLGDHGLGPYLHNGSAPSLAAVLDLVPHRTAGTGGEDLLADRRDRAALATFLASIDASTEPFGIAGPAPARPRPRPAGAEVADAAYPLRIERVYPNPVRERATIAFTLPGAGPVRLAVYDLLGRRVAVLADGARAAGRHEVTWNARGDGGARAWPGIYFVRLEAAGRVTRSAIAIAR
ncbi:MAG TPA: beta-propeller fold lactonase family protein [Candidatus Eisenbacteria bacterium]